MKRRALLIALGLLLGLPGARAENAPMLVRLKNLPPPAQSADGQLYISCQTAERAPLRRPVLQFAETVRRNFAETFMALGTAESPLAITLGGDTAPITTLRRSTIRTPDGFSQLVIYIPNPETVDLEVLRTAIVEALLRERARTLGGSYAALTWPAWFIQGAVDASKGNAFLAEAYETVHAALAQGTLPTPETLLAPNAPAPHPAIATYFARWIFDSRRTTEAEVANLPQAEAAKRIVTAKARTFQNFDALLTTPFTPQALLPSEANEAWQTWLRKQENAILLPGAITLTQFSRWEQSLFFPQTAAEAQRLASDLTRFTLGKPKLFADLTELYLCVCVDIMNGHINRAKSHWDDAEEARRAFGDILRQDKVILQEETEPVQGDRFNETTR